MSDLISRQAVIDEANAWLLDCFKVGKQDRSCGLIRRLEDLPSAQRWIPVTEALPKRGKVVLWCSAKGGVFTTAITCKDGENWNVGKRHRSAELIAWMPLPEPYKECCKGQEQKECY